MLHKKYLSLTLNFRSRYIHECKYIERWMITALNVNVCALLPLRLTWSAGREKRSRLFRVFGGNLPNGRAINFLPDRESMEERRQPRALVDLDNFRGKLFAEYVRWNRVKNSCGPFSVRNKGKARRRWGGGGGEGDRGWVKFVRTVQLLP